MATTNRREDYQRLNIDGAYYGGGLYISGGNNDGRDYDGRAAITPAELITGRVDRTTVRDRIGAIAADVPMGNNGETLDTGSSRFGRTVDELTDQTMARFESQRERMLRNEVEIVRNYDPNAELRTSDARYQQALARIDAMRDSGMDMNRVPGAADVLRDRAQEIANLPDTSAASLGETVTPALRMPERMPRFSNLDPQMAIERGASILSQASLYNPEQFPGLLASATQGQVNYALQFGVSRDTPAAAYEDMAERASPSVRNTVLLDTVNRFNTVNPYDTSSTREANSNRNLDRIAALVEAGADITNPAVAAFLRNHPEVEARRAQFGDGPSANGPEAPAEPQFINPQRERSATPQTPPQREAMDAIVSATPERARENTVTGRAASPLSDVPVSSDQVLARAALSTVNGADGYDARERQVILEALGESTDGRNGRADGRVDGKFGAASRQAEQNVAERIATGGIEGMDPAALRMAVQAFPGSIALAIQSQEAGPAGSGVGSQAVVDNSLGQGVGNSR